MVTNNLMSIAMMGIPLAFALLIWAFNTDTYTLKITLWLSSGGLFISSLIALRQAYKKAEQQDNILKEQNEKLLSVLDKINNKLK